MGEKSAYLNLGASDPASLKEPCLYTIFTSDLPRSARVKTSLAMTRRYLPRAEYLQRAVTNLENRYVVMKKLKPKRRKKEILG
ncbi:hypothetical protein NQ315_014120 [Exocentrus adspersus]|uniref:Uncharacterized protein n=1 Tax=Exocentrus adspersus TaxID=1586481 RepID=A0AAV8VVP9_9CUCU|nr:hypothetical protein NQ315_014120 [Exocentrus adspersus]